MKKHFLWFLMMLAPLAYAAPMPVQITYQGSLKVSGVPASQPQDITFRITNVDASVQYWTTTVRSVPMNNGLFSVVLTPTLQPGITWDAITPYIEVAVNGQTLGQREPITMSIYSTVSNTVMDGGITTPKLADGSVTINKIDSGLTSGSGAGLVPKGAIMMFDAITGCPSGWSQYSRLDNRFPMGSPVPGTFGGVSTHTHTVNGHTHPLPDHIHTIDDSSLQIMMGIRNIDFDNDLVMKPGAGVGSYSTVDASQWFGYGNGMATPGPLGSNPGNVGVRGPKITGATLMGGSGTTGSATATTDIQSNIPPYLSLLFCQKQ
jgi:hypothetical protein